MPIRIYLSDPSTFDQKAITAMSDALSLACQELGIGSDRKDREVVAERIIELGRQGVLDPKVLADRVVAETRAMRSL
jgi:hypothetical protein